MRKNKGKTWAGGRERRQHPRFASPYLVLRIEGHKYRTQDWSMGGFRISDFHREIRTGEDVVGSIDSFAGLVREPFEADVVRLTEEGDVCCRFLVLPKAVLNALAKAGPG